MQRLISSVLAIAVSLGTTALLANSGRRLQTQSPEGVLATDGPFRDGLYLGKLTVESGRPLVPPIARWASARDRSSFIAGFRRGYGLSRAEHSGIR